MVHILYESDLCIAIDKPVGVPFHANEVSDGVMGLLREKMASGELPSWGTLFPVHRLDAVTSGILLFGRSLEAARALSEAFAARRIQKLYLALSERKPSKKQGRIVGDMERSRRGAWKLLRTTDDPAITRFVSQSLSSIKAGMRLFLLKPETGKTHQLRVAMKSLGAPILGDALYGTSEEAQGCDRTYLHAWRLSFDIFGESVDIVAPPREGMLFAVDAVEKVLVAWSAAPFSALFP